MVKKTLLSMAIAAAVVSLAGCNVSSTDEYDNSVNLTPAQAGQPGFDPARVAPVFSAGSKNLPLFNDLIFADAAITDGTASADDTQAPVTTALNLIDGAPVSAPIDIEFNASVDIDTLNKPFSVVLLKLRNASTDGSSKGIDALDINTIVANSPVENGNPNVFAGVTQPELGKDYTVSFLDLDGGNTPTLRINLLKPLEERTKYIVALTTHIKAKGEPIGPSAEYGLLSGNLELPSEALAPVRAAVQGWESIAKGYLLGAAAKLKGQAQGLADSNPTAAAKLSGAAQLASTANVVLSYAFTTGGTTSTLKMIAAPKMYLHALAGKPDTAEKLYLGAQVGGYYQAHSIASPTPEQQQAAATFAKTQWLTTIVNPIVAANDKLSFADTAAPTDAELSAVRADAAYQATIKGAASSSTVIDGIAATLHTPKAQTYKAIPSVALTPAQVMAGTSLDTDSVTRYVQGSLTLPVGLKAPEKTNAQALASGNKAMIEGAVKLSMASDSLWTASPALNPPSDSKKFDPTKGVLTSEGVTAIKEKDKSGNDVVVGYTGGMTNVTYRYPLVNLDQTENVPVLVTLPGDYGVRDCTALEAATGLPVIVYLHGITSDRTSSLAMSQSAAFNGCFATVSMDLPLHGVAPLASDNNQKTIMNTSMTFNVEQDGGPYAAAAKAGSVTVQERHFNIASASNARVDMKFGNTVETSLGKSGDQFINLANMGRLRDNMRQAVVDNIHLLASLENIATAHGSKFDTSKVYVAGLSLGGIIGTTLTTVVNDSSVQALNSNLPKIQGVLLASPGASLPKMLENSPGFAPTVLGGLDLAQDSSSLQKYEGMLSAILSSVDPIGFAAELGAQTTPVLMYNVVGGGDCPSFVPFDVDGNPTATQTLMVGAKCSDGATQRLPSGMALAFKGKYPADHVVPNFDYFAKAESNPFARIMPGLTYKLTPANGSAKEDVLVKEMPSSASALVGTNPLVKFANLVKLDSSLDVSTGTNKFVIPFERGTHVTFAAADDTATFTTMMTQMLTFFDSNGTALNSAVKTGVKSAE